MILTIENNQIGALKWLTQKGMQETKSDTRFDAFESLSDQLHDRTMVGENNILLKLKSDKGSITAGIYLNGEFYTEIGCADLPELFEILSKHEICEAV